MAYMLLIMEPLNQRQVRTRAEGEELYERMLEFGAGLKSRGLLTTAQSLRSDTEGVRVAKPAGRLTIVDGPFAEAKEMVGGFFLLTCETRDDAVAIARTCPAAEWATVEVRELGPCFD
jgi:hypothetical protein